MKKKIVEEIINLEWKQFTNVKNEGGRAECQDEKNTFYIMRKSQYMTWSEELLISFYKDLRNADKKGWNLISEKYARMMKYTSPDRYRKIEPKLPVIDKKRYPLQEDIIKIQVTWMEEFSDFFPKIAGKSRYIHSYEDREDETSYETYLRGEIETYSDDTLNIYIKFINELKEKKINLVYEILNNTAKLYGYDSVEDAEKNLK